MKSVTYTKTGKLNFRLWEAFKKQWKLSLPRTALAILLTLISVFHPVSAAQDTMTLNIIENAVADALHNEIAQLAAQREWPTYQIEAEIRVPPSGVHLPKCQTPLLIEGRDNQSLPIGNLRRTVSCNDHTQAWRVNVALNASLTLPVVVTNANLQRGEQITASTLKLETRTLTRDTPFFTDIADATDHQVGRRIRVGKVLNPDKLIAIPLVEKGNEVVVIASKNGFSASTKGIALESGKKGEQIDVQNASSTNVVRAVVTGLNQVHTQF